MRRLGSRHLIAALPWLLGTLALRAAGPQINSISPGTAVAGSAGFTLTVNGAGFDVFNVIVIWNFGLPSATNLRTTLVNPFQATAVVETSLLTAAGVVPIAVAVEIFPTQFVNTNVVNFTITAPPLSLTAPCPLPDAGLNTMYFQRLTASGGVPPYRFRLAGGALPRGVLLLADGSVSGTPIEAGVFTPIIEVTDSQNATASNPCQLRVLGPFQASPRTLAFRSMGTVTPSQLVSLTSVVPGISYTVTTAAAWLRAAASAGTMPSSIAFTADPMPPGTYNTTATFTSPDASPRTQVVNATLVVDPPQAPRLGVEPARFQLALSEGAGVMRRVLTILNRTSGVLAWTAEPVFPPGQQPWFSIAPTSGNAAAGTPASTILTINTNILTPATTHRAAVVVRSPTTQEILQAPFVVAFSSGPLMRLSQSGFTVLTEFLGPTPPGIPLDVMVDRPTLFPVFNRFILFSGESAGWLSAASQPPAGQIQNFTVTARPTGLQPEDYDSSALFISDGAANSPRDVRVVQRVATAGTPLAPVITPTGLLFTATGSQNVRITNVRRTPITIEPSIAGDSAFSLATPMGKSIASGAFVNVEVRALTAGRRSGVYRATAFLQISGIEQVFGIDAVLIIPNMPATAEAGPHARRETSHTCVPTRLAPVSVIVPIGFVAISGLPVPLEARVLDDCGNPMTSGVVTASFSNGEPPVVFTHFPTGRWSGTWHVRQVPAAPVSITIRADDPERNLTGSVVMSGTVQANGGAPIISDGGVLSTASFALNAPLAPGSLVAIFGSNLADGQASASSLPLPAVLGSTSAVIGGRSIPLFFAGNPGAFSQVNGMLPYGVSPNTTYQLSVRKGVRRSNFEEVVIAPTQPSTFTLTQTGSGQGVVVDGTRPTVVVDAGNPIARGGVIIIYCEGLGPVNPPAVEGQAVRGAPLSVTATPATVTIGGVDAQVLFAGLTPFFTGLYQLNVLVPETVTPGAAVTVEVTVAGQTSRPVTIAVE